MLINRSGVQVLYTEHGLNVGSAALVHWSVWRPSTDDYHSVSDASPGDHWSEVDC